MRLKFGVLIASAMLAFQAKSQIIITGVMVDPSGADAGYEYVQLMATKDIDFSQTPFAMVRCMNTTSFGPIGAEGWATGGERTFKFNLTKGKVSKGAFFYVGGEKKRIAGYWQGIQSSDISEKAELVENRANWIRTLKYKGEPDGIVVGDGFGEKTNGLIPNGKSHPVGIAVFAGTDVNANTVPVDVIFIATANPISNTARIASYNPAQGVGYLVPDNDMYSTKKSKFFADATNTSAFLYPNATGVGLALDLGAFLMLGGVYNVAKQKWDKPRSTNYVQLCNDKVADVSSITKLKLADIEKAAGVTVLK